MSHVFISYSKEDGEFAENVQHRLQQAGFTVWRDVQLRGGEDWRQGIDDGIRKAFALIIVMSPDAKNSEYVTYEWAFAWGVGIKVIPILFKSTNLHPRLESLQYLNFTNRDARPWNELFELLRDAEKSENNKGKPAPSNLANHELNQAAYERMIKKLKEPGYDWRTLDTLAVKGGVSTEEAKRILGQDRNVEFGRNNETHEELARLLKK